MIKRSIINCFFILLSTLSSFQSFSQNDSILKARADALQVYDTAKVAMVDTSIFELTRINNAADALIEIDNSIINNHFVRYIHLNDSLSQQLSINQTINTNIQSQFSYLQTTLVILEIISIFCFLLMLVMAVIYFSNRRQCKRIIIQNSEQQNVIAEYRKKLSLLQEELNVAKDETGALMDSLSRYRVDTMTKDGNKEE